jgi:hypothetical protein
MTETLTAADMVPAVEPVVTEAPEPTANENGDKEFSPKIPLPYLPPPPEEGQKYPKWEMARIRVVTARLAAEAKRADDAARELDVTKAALARYETQQRGQQPQDNQSQQAPAQSVSTERDIEARAAALAAQRVEANDFNSRSNAVFESGTASYPDFAEKLTQFDNLGGLGQHIDFVKDVIDLPNGAQVLYALASNLDQAAHVLNLPARKQAMALATLSNHLAGSAPAATQAAQAATPPATASKAPPPIRPIAGKASQGPADIYDPKISMSDYIKMRTKK